MRFSYLLTTPLANALDNARRCESSGISIYGSSDKKDFYRRRLFDVISTSEVARKEHIVNVRQNQERWDAAVENGKYPRGGGDLVLREGKYGQFYGCSNYPKCKYILNK